MRISKIWAAGLGAIVLSGCLNSSLDEKIAPVTQLAVAEGTVVVTGPSGYCVDTTLTRDRSDEAFVLFASCAALTNDPLQPQPDLPVVATASVTKGVSTSVPALRRYFQSNPQGVAKVLADEDRGILLFRSENWEWRGLIPLPSAVLVTVALQGRPTSQDEAEDQRAILESFARRIVANNAMTF